MPADSRKTEIRNCVTRNCLRGRGQISSDKSAKGLIFREMAVRPGACSPRLVGGREDSPRGRPGGQPASC